MRPSYNDPDKPSVWLEIEKLKPQREVLATGRKPRREFSANCGLAANGRCSGRAVWKAAFTASDCTALRAGIGSGFDPGFGGD
jgi:hypothetical protein